MRQQFLEQSRYANKSYDTIVGFMTIYSLRLLDCQNFRSLYFIFRLLDIYTCRLFDFLTLHDYVTDLQDFLPKKILTMQNIKVKISNDIVCQHQMPEQYLLRQLLIEFFVQTQFSSKCHLQHIQRWGQIFGIGVNFSSEYAVFCLLSSVFFFFSIFASFLL